MGIINIHILQEPNPFDKARQDEAAYVAQLVKDHYQGKHTYGMMRRDCPLCNP